MTKARKRRRPSLLASKEQQKALGSPLRLEVLGHFTTPGGMSIAEVAERMGRSPGSLYYHFRVLEDVGILQRVGSRPGTKRSEALFEPVAARFEFPAEPESDASIRSMVKTLSSAFRMAEKDLEAAVREGTARPEGAHRNFYATRMHCRISRKTLAEINRHLVAIEKLLGREIQRSKLPADANQLCSLTLALLPLRGREQG